jgi:MFS family permease
MVGKSTQFHEQWTKKKLERARKVNIWAFTFLLGPFLGPFISSFLLSKISWRFDMGVLAMFYGVSAIVVALFGEETLYDRQNGVKPTSGASRISLLIGIAGVKSKGQTTMLAVSKHLIQIAIKPQLLLPCKISLTQNTYFMLTPWTRSVCPDSLHLGHRNRHNRHAIHSPPTLPP